MDVDSVPLLNLDFSVEKPKVTKKKKFQNSTGFPSKKRKIENLSNGSFQSKTEVNRKFLTQKTVDKPRSEPFLLSNSFGQKVSAVSGNKSVENEEFTVSFVKPKLFRKKVNSTSETKVKKTRVAKVTEIVEKQEEERPVDKTVEKWGPDKKVEKFSADTKVENWSPNKKVEKWSVGRKVEKFSTDKKVEKWGPDKEVEKWSTDRKVEKFLNDKTNEEWGANKKVKRFSKNNKDGHFSTDTKVEKFSTVKKVEKWGPDTEVGKFPTDKKVEKWGPNKKVKTFSTDNKDEHFSTDTKVEKFSTDTKVEKFSTDTKVEKFSSDKKVEKFSSDKKVEKPIFVEDDIFTQKQSSGSKWFVGSKPEGVVKIEFPTAVGKKVEKAPIERPKLFDEQEVEGLKRATKTARNKEKPERTGFRGENRWERDEKTEMRTAGPASSLFTHTPVVHKLDDMDVEPLEEELFSKKTYKGSDIHPHLIGNLEQYFGITKMTMVQKKTIPPLLDGKHALVRSQTGSGKTLAYAIPIMQALQSAIPKLTRTDGVKALIILPTRELALQTYECFTKLMRAFTWIVPGIVVGGEKRKSEKVRLRKGINVLIGTPGRLQDHAENTKILSFHSIDWLIIDEADKLLEMGYEKNISDLIAVIDKQREESSNPGRKQTVLLSATLTPGVEKLANLTLQDPVRIDACDTSQIQTDVLVIPQSLTQTYVVVPAKLRLVTLASFIVNVTEFETTNKILIFMATQDMVDFYMDLIPSTLSVNVKFFKLHGNMSQGDRTEVFNSFRKSAKGVLLSTDVAARGLDLPKVDWIVQYTAPTTPAEYVHRVGRTARVGTSGSSLLFLLPSELHFVSMLNSSRVKLDETNLDKYLKVLMKIHLESKTGDRWGGGVDGACTVLQQNFEHAVIDDKDLHDLAAKAYKSWVRFYATYPKDLRIVFDFKSLHLGHHAKSFALRDPPKAIGGIGKPQKALPFQKNVGRRPQKATARSNKKMGLGHVSETSRTKRLIMSEFDSGLKPLKK